MPENIKEILAENLRYYMEKNKINQSDICHELKVSSATVSDWCNGAKFPRPDALGQLADLFGIRLSMLVSKEGPINYQEQKDDQERLEALHQNPRLGLLFDHTRKMKTEDVDFMIEMAERMINKNNQND